jgi:hypothetical protein
MNPPRPVLRSLLVIGIMSLAVVSCGGRDDSGGGGTQAAPATSATAPATSAPAPKDPNAVIDPGDGGNYAPTIDPANFVAVIDNPYLPLLPGARWRYKGRIDGEPENVEVVVTSRRKQIMGISAVVVTDKVFDPDGNPIEITSDWFAQDRQGNVWYLGEDTKEYENGKVSSTAGSWETGKDGALPGIAMPAAPATGHAYRQEYYKGEAEDMAEIAGTGQTATTAAKRYDQVVVIKEWTPLEPKVIEDKSYAPGVGMVLQVHQAGGVGRVELVDFTPGKG